MIEAVITPYSTMNTMLVNQTVGLVWWHNMVKAKRMQSELLVESPFPKISLDTIMGFHLPHRCSKRMY